MIQVVRFLAISVSVFLSLALLSESHATSITLYDVEGQTGLDEPSDEYAVFKGWIAIAQPQIIYPPDGDIYPREWIFEIADYQISLDELILLPENGQDDHIRLYEDHHEDGQLQIGGSVGLLGQNPDTYHGDPVNENSSWIIPDGTGFERFQDVISVFPWETAIENHFQKNITTMYIKLTSKSNEYQVPEPMTILLLSCGLIGLVGLRTRKKI